MMGMLKLGHSAKDHVHAEHVFQEQHHREAPGVGPYDDPELLGYYASGKEATDAEVTAFRCASFLLPLPLEKFGDYHYPFCYH